LADENPVIYTKIMAIYESQKILLEGSNEAVNLLLGEDLSSLTADQRVSIQDWHKGIQQAVNALSFPE
jgi:hypothetical protein